MQNDYHGHKPVLKANGSYYECFWCGMRMHWPGWRYTCPSGAKMGGPSQLQRRRRDQKTLRYLKKLQKKKEEE